MQRPAHQLLPINVNRNLRFSVRVFGVSAAGDLRRTYPVGGASYKSPFSRFDARSRFVCPHVPRPHTTAHFVRRFALTCIYMHLVAPGMLHKPHTGAQRRSLSASNGERARVRCRAFTVPYSALRVPPAQGAPL